jgi:hypothetical protein
MSSLSNTLARAWRLTAVFAVPALLAACERSVDTTSPLSPTAGTLDRSDDERKSAVPTVNARLLVSKDGLVTFEASTAAFDVPDAVANGKLDQVHYILTDSTRRVRYVGAVKPRVPGVRLVDTIPANLRDDRGRIGEWWKFFFKTPSAVNLTPAWTVTVNAQVVGAKPASCPAVVTWRDYGCYGYEKREVEVRVATSVSYSPDVQAGAISQLIGTDAAPLAELTQDSVRTFIASISNNPPASGLAFGALTSCSVTVDGQTPANVTYFWEVGGQVVPGGPSNPIYIPAGEARICRWTLSHHELGRHTMAVTPTVVSPRDNDVTNNTASQGFDVVDWAPQPTNGPPAGPAENPLAATITERAWFDAAGNLTQLNYQGAAVANFVLPALSAADAAASSYAITFALTTGETLVNGDILSPATMYKLTWTGTATPAGCVDVSTLVGAEVLANRNSGSGALSLCFTPDGGALVPSLEYMRSSPTLVPANVAEGILLYGKYVKFELVVSRTFNGVTTKYGGVAKLTTSPIVCDDCGVGPGGGTVRTTKSFYATWP